MCLFCWCAFVDGAAAGAEGNTGAAAGAAANTGAAAGAAVNIADDGQHAQPDIDQFGEEMPDRADDLQRAAVGEMSSPFPCRVDTTWILSLVSDILS